MPRLYYQRIHFDYTELSVGAENVHLLEGALANLASSFAMARRRRRGHARAQSGRKQGRRARASAAALTRSLPTLACRRGRCTTRPR